MKKRMITAATLMEIYGVTRPTAINWFNDKLIIGERGGGVTDSWIATPQALKAFHAQLTCINVWKSGELINLSAPFNQPVKELAELTGVSYPMAHKYLRAGYVPGAVKLPYAKGDWRLPAEFKTLALSLKEATEPLEVQIGQPLTPLPEQFLTCE